MIDRGRHNLLGVWIDAVDYDAAVDRVIQAARERKACAVAALAVHGVMTGALARDQRYRLNRLDMNVPDGQPVRWALNLLHNTALRDRVYGPTLTLQVCARAAEEGLPVFLYGSRPVVLETLRRRLLDRYPRLIVAGSEPSQFRRLSRKERDDVVARIRQSGAAIVFVGMGCPRQEVWCYENREALSMPALAVGAAFDFHAGLLSQAPAFLQKLGLEWLYRLAMEPRRLWRRYALFNPMFIALVAMQKAGWRPEPEVSAIPEELRFG